MRKKPKISRLAAASLETAGDMRRVGVMGSGTYENIILRHFGRGPGLAESSSNDATRSAEGSAEAN
jgi:hypothetical protein